MSSFPRETSFYVAKNFYFTFCEDNATPYGGGVLNFFVCFVCLFLSFVQKSVLLFFFVSNVRPHPNYLRSELGVTIKDLSK